MYNIVEYYGTKKEIGIAEALFEDFHILGYEDNIDIQFWENYGIPENDETIKSLEVIAIRYL